MNPYEINEMLDSDFDYDYTDKDPDYEVDSLQIISKKMVMLFK